MVIVIESSHKMLLGKINYQIAYAILKGESLHQVRKYIRTIENDIGWCIWVVSFLNLNTLHGNNTVTIDRNWVYWWDYGTPKKLHLNWLQRIFLNIGYLPRNARTLLLITAQILNITLKIWKEFTMNSVPVLSRIKVWQIVTKQLSKFFAS